MSTTKKRLTIPGGTLGELAALLDLPAAKPDGWALYAHCFTCNKDSFAASRIGSGLAERGMAILRFDFTGLGGSRGDFAKTNLSSNVADVLAAAELMRQQHEAPQLLIGHSLGGVAMLLAAPKIPEVQAVVLLNSPPRADHLLWHFGAHLQEIEEHGAANVPVYEKATPRRFRLQKQFVDDLRRHDLAAALRALHKPLLVLYSEQDDLMSQDEGYQLYEAAQQPKHWRILPGADHILTAREHGMQAARIIVDWYRGLA